MLSDNGNTSQSASSTVVMYALPWMKRKCPAMQFELQDERGTQFPAYKETHVNLIVMCPLG